MKQALEVVQEIKRLEEAIASSDSPYLKKDYGKKVKNLKRDLKEYCFYRGFIYKDLFN